MSPGSSTESYPAFARIGLRENPGKTSTREWPTVIQERHLDIEQPIAGTNILNNLSKFSRYKNCLSNRRRRFSFDNLREYIAVSTTLVIASMMTRIELARIIPKVMLRIIPTTTIHVKNYSLLKLAHTFAEDLLLFLLGLFTSLFSVGEIGDSEMRRGFAIDYPRFALRMGKTSEQAKPGYTFRSTVENRKHRLLPRFHDWISIYKQITLLGLIDWTLQLVHIHCCLQTCISGSTMSVKHYAIRIALV
ncbi:hypothetical protein ANN_19579 [Periplaneta americana]|uniref:Ion transport domain-containing protein n=1 Tax=Periplaneta americana TaxID=6978 RepID=A0ABQ8SBE1_PERAM|nr:hypothetical protein ANN_19579 [Periplaneta americana]